MDLVVTRIEYSTGDSASFLVSEREAISLFSSEKYALDGEQETFYWEKIFRAYAVVFLHKKKNLFVKIHLGNNL